MDEEAKKSLYDAIQSLNMRQGQNYESPESEGAKLKKFSLLKDVEIEYTFATTSCTKT